MRLRIEAALGAGLAYMQTLDTHTAAWATDCEAIRKDLLVLEPHGKQFAVSMFGFVEWAGTSPQACRDRVPAIGEAHPQTRELDQLTSIVAPRVDAAVARCKDHPGFADALSRGFTAMKKKRDP